MEMTDRTVTTMIQGRVFPPPYNATGNASIDRLAFFHVLEQLKVSTGRNSGWMEVLLTES